MGAEFAPPQCGILETEDEERSRLRPKRSRKKRRRQEDRQEEVEIGKTPCKKDRKDPIAVQIGHQDEDKIIMEKPQTHSEILLDQS